jgi:signal transduction histidine kinase
VGFDPALADKIFEPFVQLNPESRFGGAGVGLATEDRIIRRHGGRVWAEGRPDAGATIFWTLGQ